MSPSHEISATRLLWTNLRNTPLADMLRGRLTGNLDVGRAIAAAALPEPLADLIRKVVRGTRLWRVERVDVAHELAEHFRDGLAAGWTAEQLIGWFGKPGQAARLIRRARLRSRPLFWRMWRRGVQAMCVVAALVAASYLFFAIRLFTSHPTLAHNYRLEVIAPTQGVPEADRAWPCYREAILHLTPEPTIVDPSTLSPDDGSASNAAESVEAAGRTMISLDVEAERPGSKHWDEVARWLDENQIALGEARQGGTRPRFGFVYNDPADRAWLDSTRTDPKSMDPNRNEEVFSFPLPQLQYLGPLRRLLEADARRAMANSDGQAFLSDIQTLIRMADQIHGDQPIWVFGIFSFFYIQDALALIDEALAGRPELLNDDGLRDLAHCVAGYAGGGRIELRLEGNRLMELDLYQRAYSDNGQGDGVLTREGLALLKELQDLTGSTPSIAWTDPTVGPALAALIPSRRAMTELTAEYFDRAEREFNRPLWQWADSDVRRDMDRWQNSVIDRVRRAPLSLMFDRGPDGGIPDWYYKSEIVTAQRDATLVALALNLYHRRHGSWPEHLAELVPDMLPAVPPDHFTGRPLGYRLVDGEPLLYSVGPDRKDDGGRSLEHPKELLKSASLWAERDQANASPTGDWILWPPPSEAPQ